MILDSGNYGYGMLILRSFRLFQIIFSQWFYNWRVIYKKQTGDDQSMLIDNVEQDPEKQQDVTIISPQQSLDSESIEEKDAIMMADNC